MPYASKNFQRICGLSPQDVVHDARPFFERVHAEDAALVRRSLALSARKLEPWRGEFRYWRNDAETIWLETQSTPIAEPDGSILWRGYLHEVTERKRAEEASRASEARLQATIDGVTDAIITTDDAGRVLSFNKAALTMFGYEAHELLGREASLLMPEAERSKHEAYFLNRTIGLDLDFLDGGRKGQGRRKDGSLFPLEMRISEARCEDRRLFVSFVRDLSERHMIEARMKKLHAERLNAVGGMATALAHEINQPLSATAVYLKAARRLLRIPPERRVADLDDVLDSAAAQIMRAGQIVAHLRDFIVRGEPDKTLLNLHGVIGEVHDLMLPAAKREGVQVKLRLEARDDLVLADKVQIRQALINLFRNAIEAMSLTQARVLTLSTANTQNDMIETEARDTGRGFSDEVRASLFEPFMTTKTGGMGVGLSVSRSIVAAHYGEMWAASNPEGGASFRFTLPLARGETEHDA